MFPTRPSDGAAAARRFRHVALVAPVAAAALLAAAQLALVPFVPASVAIHWGPSGEPDGYGPSWTFATLTLGVGAGLAVLLAGSVLVGADQPAQRRRFRTIAAIVWAQLAFVGVISCGAMIAQVGLDDGAAAPSVLPLLLIAVPIAAALGCLAWWLTWDPEPSAADAPVVPEPVAVAGSERVAWLQTAGLGRIPAIVTWAVVTATGALATAAVTGDLAAGGGLTARSWIALATLAIAAVSAGALTLFRVRVDERGLEVRSALGWPRVRIPRADIARAELAHVDPMGEYGGWGWRYASGSGTGVVLRRGEALRVTRRGGRVFTVTVDDAETAAGLLRGLKERDAG